MPAGTVINGPEDTVAVILEILETAQREVDFLSSPSFLSFAGTYDTMENAKRLIQRGGVVRGVVPVSHANIEGVRMRLHIGEDLRHSDQFNEVFMFVGDGRQSLSSINAGTIELTSRPIALSSPFGVTILPMQNISSRRLNRRGHVLFPQRSGYKNY